MLCSGFLSDYFTRLNQLVEQGVEVFDLQMHLCTSSQGVLQRPGSTGILSRAHDYVPKLSSESLQYSK